MGKGIRQIEKRIAKKMHECLKTCDYIQIQNCVIPLGKKCIRQGGKLRPQIIEK